jgi:hypothetical protein
MHANQAADYQLTVLRAIMGYYPQSSQAWKDFQAACAKELGEMPQDSTTNARVSAEIWSYWSAVATGKNRDYDINGTRVATR